MNNTTNGEGAEWEVIDERIRFGFYIIFLVIGSVGNVMLIGIIARKKSSKTVFELFVLNLAVSDLLLILLYIGPSVYSFIAEFSASLFYCKFLWPISTFAFLLEIFSMTSMAIHRLWLIVYYQKPKPKKRAACAWIMALWVTAFAVTLPLMVVSQVTNVVPPANCHEDWPSVSHRRAYTVVLLLLQYIIPLVLIGSAYARIAIFLYIRPRGSTSAPAPEGRRNSAGRASRRDNIQVIKTLAAIVVLFAIGMLPIQVAWMIADFGSPAAQDARTLKFLFHVGDLSLCFHACVDPWIYGIFAKRFRQDYIDCCYTFICCCFRRYRPVPQQNELLMLSPQ